MADKKFMTLRSKTGEIGTFFAALAIILIWVSGGWNFLNAKFFLLVGVVSLIAAGLLFVFVVCLVISGHNLAQRVVCVIVSLLVFVLCLWLIFRGFDFLEAAWTHRNYKMLTGAPCP